MLKLIEPKVEFFDESKVTSNQHIARCARVCYGGENKSHTLEQDNKLVQGLINKGHLSMLRHGSVYLDLSKLSKIEREFITSTISSNVFKDWGCVSCNMQEYMFGNVGDAIDNLQEGSVVTMDAAEFLKQCEKNPEYFKSLRMTFCITTQIATSRELNRKSPNNIAERSTRYCSSKDGLDICKPWWWNDADEEKRNDYLKYMESAYTSYKDMLNLGFKPEDARGVLPLDTATRVVYTYTIKELKDILDLRLYDKYGVAHPNCKVVMRMVKEQINKFLEEHNCPKEYFV